MGIESSSLPSFEQREIAELKIDQEIERIACQRRLIPQVAGRQIDTLADEYLIEQVNEMFIETIFETSGRDYSLVGCLTVGCDRTCVIKTEQGAVSEVERSASGNCLEAVVSIGRSASR